MTINSGNSPSCRDSNNKDLEHTLDVDDNFNDNGIILSLAELIDILRIMHLRELVIRLTLRMWAPSNPMLPYFAKKIDKPVFHGCIAVQPSLFIFVSVKMLRIFIL